MFNLTLKTDMKDAIVFLWSAAVGTTLTIGAVNRVIGVIVGLFTIIFLICQIHNKILDIKLKRKDLEDRITGKNDSEADK